MNKKWFIIEDSILVQKKLSQMAESLRDTVIGIEKDGNAAILACDKNKPDVVIMNLSTSQMTGTTGIKSLLKHCPDVKIIIYGMIEEKKQVTSAIEAGAKYVLAKPFTIDQMREAIRTVTK